MERFIVSDCILIPFNSFKFKIQYGEIYSMLKSFDNTKILYLKSSMERFIDKIFNW